MYCRKSDTESGCEMKTFLLVVFLVWLFWPKKCPKCGSYNYRGDMKYAGRCLDCLDKNHRRR